MTIETCTVRVERASNELHLSQPLCMSLSQSLLISIPLELVTICKISIDANIYAQAPVTNLKQLESRALSMSILPQGNLFPI